MERLAGGRALVVGVGDRDTLARAIPRRVAAEGARTAVAGRPVDAPERHADEIDGVACDFTTRAAMAAPATPAPQVG